MEPFNSREVVVRIVFWHSDKPREGILAEAFAEGARKHGDVVSLRSLTPDHTAATDCDVACMVGVKSRELFWNHWREGVHTVYFDKGYNRESATGPVKIWKYWRVSVDAHNPTGVLESVERPLDRIESIIDIIQPWRKTGKHIVFAGSSAKYHEFYGLHEPTRFAQKVVMRLKELTDREIIYRPKPSWKDATPVKFSTYSGPDQSIEDVLRDANVLVTHGSNSCFEAVATGIPCIVLGEAVAKSISSTKLEEVESPRLATDEERRQWFARLSYCQWTLSEMASGEAWAVVRPQIYGN